MASTVEDLNMVPVEVPSDWAAYHEIRRAVLFNARGRGDAYNEHHPDDRSPTNHPLLLIANGEAVAAVRGDFDVEPDAAVFRRLAVRAPLQRQGYDRALMQRAEEFARSERRHRFVAYVAPDAIGFWLKLGYRISSIQLPGADPRVEKQSHEG